MGCVRCSGDHVVRAVVLQDAVSTMGFELVIYMDTAVTNILVCDPTVSDAVVLSAAVTVSFHSCGKNTNASETGLQYTAPLSMWIWLGNTVKN